MPNSTLFIVLDNDKRDVKLFRKELEDVALYNMIVIDHVFCIAVKEMEAWLLGDADAIEKAYPSLRKNLFKKYVQDDICDTWEILADMVYPGGLAKLKKISKGSYYEIGKAKKEWADNIGKYLNLTNNNSPSFRYFINSLKERIKIT